MMKVLRFFCNIILLFAIAIGISVIQIGVYDLTAAQSSDVDAIYITHSNDETEKVSYLNSYGFWANDISTNFKAEPRYRTRNWSTNAKWKRSVGKWLDYGIDAVISVVKPIVLPIASINGMKNYYGMGINVPDIIKGYAQDYTDTVYVNDALYELYVIYGRGYGNAYIVKDGFVKGENVKLSDMVLFDEEGKAVPIINHNYPTEKLATINAEIKEIGAEASFGRWVKNNKTLYNENWKLTKYNSEKYDLYARKFLRINYSYVLDDGGRPTTTVKVNEIGLKVETSKRVISSAALVLYYQQYVSLIVALIFVLRYPVNFVQLRVIGKKKKKAENEGVVA